MRVGRLGVVGAGILFSVAAVKESYGAGFEKTILWSGKRNGVAGAGTAGTKGAEALYFNPAGVVDTTKAEASANFSPTFLGVNAPVQPGGAGVDATTQTVPVYGVMGSLKLTDKLALAAGSYASGGASVVMENLNISPAFSMKPSLSSKIQVIEYSLGAAYEIVPGLKIGAAWRIVQVGAKVVIPGVTGPALTEVTLDNLSKTRYNGFRLGAQYDGNGWGVGAQFRSAVEFTLDGTASGRMQIAGTPNIINIPSSPVTAQNTFPTQISVGSYVDLFDKTARAILEYQYTNYSVNRSLQLQGTLGGRPLAGLSLVQDWQDLHVGRLGVEYGGIKDVTLRAGYALTGQVTPKSQARPTFTAPGIAHTMTLGAGTSMLQRSLDLDLAVEYSTGSATVTAADVGAGSQTPTGDYKTAAVGIHAGATYRF